MQTKVIQEPKAPTTPDAPVKDPATEAPEEDPPAIKPTPAKDPAPTQPPLEDPSPSPSEPGQPAPIIEDPPAADANSYYG